LFDPIARGYEHNNSKWKCLQVLLVLEILVGRQEDVKLAAGAAWKFTILQPGPPHLSDRTNVMTRDLGFELDR
jgi:hypothetical protein